MFSLDNRWLAAYKHAGRMHIPYILTGTLPWTTLKSALWQHLRVNSRIMTTHRAGTEMSRCLRQFLSDVPMEEKHAMP
eukprot:4096286-Karenia_brevis.AAC.1